MEQTALKTRNEIDQPFCHIIPDMLSLSFYAFVIHYNGNGGTVITHTPKKYQKRPNITKNHQKLAKMRRKSAKIHIEQTGFPSGHPPEY